MQQGPGLAGPLTDNAGQVMTGIVLFILSSLVQPVHCSVSLTLCSVAPSSYSHTCHSPCMGITLLRSRMMDELRSSFLYG